MISICKIICVTQGKEKEIIDLYYHLNTLPNILMVCHNYYRLPLTSQNRNVDLPVVKPIQHIMTAYAMIDFIF